MPTCELIETCRFFNDKMAGIPATATAYKKIFCEGDNSMCARYMVCMAKGRDQVPPSLFPNEFERAKSIIGE